MTRTILEKEKNKVIDGVNKLCESILSCENDKAGQEDLIEQFCYLADLLHVSTDPALLSHITLEKIEKCLVMLKPKLGFRFRKISNDPYCDFIIKKNKTEIEIELCDDNSIYCTWDDNNISSSFHGFRQFIYHLSDLCGVDMSWNELVYDSFVD